MKAIHLFKAVVSLVLLVVFVIVSHDFAEFESQFCFSLDRVSSALDVTVDLLKNWNCSLIIHLAMNPVMEMMLKWLLRLEK